MLSSKGYMSIKITGRHLVITSALRQHVESRFERLVRYDVKLTHLEVIFIDMCPFKLSNLSPSAIQL